LNLCTSPYIYLINNVITNNRSHHELTQTPLLPRTHPLTQRLNRFITKHIANFNILLFEFVGTGFFAYGVMVCLNSTTPLVPTSIEGVFASLFISLCLFLSLVFVGPLTGGHFNPAVTMAFMIKKEGRVGWSKALLYMVAQMTGAWMGALFGTNS
jgi:glycerol uptake facilitator-like aquaporin